MTFPEALQVPDDRVLLETMMADMKQGGDLYQPTNYWAYYERYLLPELTKRGLRDFRRRHGSVLTSFGATDLQPFGVVEIGSRVPAARRVAAALNRLIERLPGITLRVWGVPAEFRILYFYNQVSEKFQAIGFDIRSCPTTRLGNPEDLLEIDGAAWSFMHLQYCAIFADAYRHLSLKPDAVICELGPGMGRNLEVIARLFPNATLLAFDIPPQLYVANQYLTSVFGKRALGYGSALQVEPRGRVPDEARGRIVMLPTWKMPEWSGVPVDVFWNSASFQEMEPAVVRNYLGLVRSMRPEFIYINALPQGNYWGGASAGTGGTKLPVTEREYKESLSGSYRVLTEYATDYFLRSKDYRSYVFGRL